MRGFRFTGDRWGPVAARETIAALDAAAIFNSDLRSPAPDHVFLQNAVRAHPGGMYANYSQLD